MKLYYMSFSSYSQKVLIALYEKEVAFEREKVVMFDPAAKAAYEKIYPFGKVPMLMIDDHMIPESTIIIEYLEGHYSSDTKLIPDGVDEARKVRFMDRMNDFYLNNTMITLLFDGMKPEAERNEEETTKARKHIDICYQHLDEILGKQDWLCGNELTMADCSAIPPLFYAKNIHPYDDRKNIVAYMERALQRPSYQKVLEEALPELAEFQKAMGM